MLAAEKVIWSAWNHMGDKEVAREAAAKGHHHLDLAIMFLSNRLKLPDLETRAWMVDEVNLDECKINGLHTFNLQYRF